MKTIQKIILFLVAFMPAIAFAAAKEIPFTLDDRDRLIRTEQKAEALQTEMAIRFEAVNKQFEAVNKQFEADGKQYTGFRSEINARFDQLFNFLWAIIGIFPP